MSTHKFEIVEHDPEDFEFLVNDETVGRVTHDSLGWQGISDMKNMFETIAEKLGVEVEERMAGE